jgi:hypothetical protein
VLLGVGDPERRVEDDAAQSSVDGREPDGAAEQPASGVDENAEEAVEDGRVETVGEPADAEGLEPGGLEDHWDEAVRGPEVAVGRLPGEDAPAAVEDDRLVERHEADPSPLEADPHAKGEQSGPDREGRGPADLHFLRTGTIDRRTHDTSLPGRRPSTGIRWSRHAARVSSLAVATRRLAATNEFGKDTPLVFARA